MLPRRTTPLVDKMRIVLMADLEARGVVSIPLDQPTRIRAAREMIDAGLAIERAGSPGDARLRKPSLSIMRNPHAVGTAEWERAAGRLSPADPHKPTTPDASMARLLGVETSGPAFEALADAVASRVLPALLEALRRPQTADTTADEDLLRVLDGRTGFTMDQVLAWMGWPLDRPALRIQVGAQLRRLGFAKKRVKGQFGEDRHIYAGRGGAEAGDPGDFAGQLAGALEGFSRVTQAEAAEMVGIVNDQSARTRIGRAMPRIGFRKRVLFANTAERTIEYERIRR